MGMVRDGEWLEILVLSTLGKRGKTWLVGFKVTLKDAECLLQSCGGAQRVLRAVARGGFFSVHHLSHGSAHCCGTYIIMHTSS